VTLPEGNPGPPRQAEGAPAESDTPPELALPVDDLTKVRQPVDGRSRAGKIFALLDACGEEITS
jgi:hypothetical protein